MSMTTLRLWVGRVVVPVLAVLALTPYASSAMALTAGVVVAIAIGNPYLDVTRKAAGPTLQAAVVGLGFGMNLMVVAAVGAHGVGYTLFGIVLALSVGALVGKLLGVTRDAGFLVSVGTAICGGSAIAAASSAMGAKKEDTTVALAVVFSLNAVGLLVFPPLGHFFSLDQGQFGLWAALAIHDTSSVVGAAGAYGPEALAIATTVKLSRALWIIPVSLLAGWVARNDAGPVKVKRKLPWFILGFVIAAALATFIPQLTSTGALIAGYARHLFVLALFLIGAGLSRDALKMLGLRPLLLGIVLWAVTASITLAAIVAHVIT